jgi:L-fuculose-phosphate aldolase
MLETVKQEIIKYGRLAGTKDMTPGISGNISARVGDSIVITASGVANGYLATEDLVVTNFDGALVDGLKKPSSERFLHIEFYKQRSDVNCVFHVHSPFLTAFASAGKGLTDGISPEIIYCFGQIPLAPYALPGSKELVDNTKEFFKDYDVILMENHGVIVGAEDIKGAYLKLELAENYAKTIICTNLLGGAKILPKEEIEKIYELKRGN